MLHSQTLFFPYTTETFPFRLRKGNFQFSALFDFAFTNLHPMQAHVCVQQTRKDTRIHIELQDPHILFQPCSQAPMLNLRSILATFSGRSTSLLFPSRFWHWIHVMCRGEQRQIRPGIIVQVQETRAPRVFECNVGLGNRGNRRKK